MKTDSLTFIGIRYLLTIVVVLAIIGAALTGCNKIQMSEMDAFVDPLNAVEPPDTGIVRESCATSTLKSITKAYNFPKPGYTCEWEKNGNLAPRNNYFQGRIDDEKILELETGAVICDVSFSFAEQDFLYDDHFLFTFNDSIIASSYDFSKVLQRRYGFYHYDWSKIAGMYWDKDDEGIICPESGASCSFPGHDQAGVISIDYSSDFFKRIMALDLGRTRHSIKFTSLGDNDDDDCEHSDVSFDLTVKYVVVR